MKAIIKDWAGWAECKYVHSRRRHMFGFRHGHHLHDDVSEGLNLLHGAGCELCAFMRVEHDQIDLALNVLHQLHQPAHQQSGHQTLDRGKQTIDSSVALNEGVECKGHVPVHERGRSRVWGLYLCM